MQNGRYAEAEEAYLAADEPTRRNDQDGLKPQLEATLALGKAECQASQGEYAKAIEVLKAARRPATQECRPAGAAGRALLHPRRLGAAEAAVQAGPEKLDPDHLLARWIDGRLLELRGELERRSSPASGSSTATTSSAPDLAQNADALLLVGQAAERYYRATARGEELSDSLNDVINEIYEAALRADPNCWQAPWLEGRLFLSGYNERAAAQASWPAPSRSIRCRPKCW